MNSFSISQLQRYSGISVHSIRAWEKRYDALKPNRSEGNTRCYTGNQLRRLLNISSMMDSTHKISELCAMTDAELFLLMNKRLEETINGDEFLVSQAVSAALEFNEPLFNTIFSKAIASYGIEGAYLSVIYPTLQRMGIMWAADTIAPAQEHFISNLIKQKLNTSIDLMSVNNQSNNHWLLFLPENEFHEIGLLMANYLIRNAGHRCTYLGSNVPLDSVKQAVDLLKPTSVLFYTVANNDGVAVKKLIRTMMNSFSSQKIFAAGNTSSFTSLEDNSNFFMLKSIDELKSTLTSMSK